MADPRFPRLHQFIEPFRVEPGRKVRLPKDFDPGYTGDLVTKEQAADLLAEGVKLLSEYQARLAAQDTWSLLVIFQAMDAAGKDGTIRHVMSGVNPQGVEVTSFKVPSELERDHDYLWRSALRLPRRGDIGIFNRSYYEEVLVVRVHPSFLGAQKLPSHLMGKDIWHRRFEEINNFEKYLVNNGILVLKFFLNVSPEEQGRRFLERATRPDKNWKFSAADMKEREHWDEYMEAYEDMFNHTSTEWAPWHIVPADHKWFTRLSVAAVLVNTLDNLNLSYPTVSEEQKTALLVAKAQLEAQGIRVEDEDDSDEPAKPKKKSKKK